jgi:hypothetical protein
MWAAVAVVLIALLATVGCGQSTLDSKAVRNQAEQVHSFAVEGGIVVDQLRHHGLKESYAQVHAADLADLAAKSQQELEPSLATPKLKHTVERLQTLAEDVSTQLRGVETDPREERVLEGAAKRFDDVAGEADRIEGRL